MRNYHWFWIVALLTLSDAHAAAITVNTATDDFGAVPGNCSLREAIESANDNADFDGCNSTGVYGNLITDVITLPTLGPGGFFTLTRIGTDDTNNSGDLDINGNLRIEGASTLNSVIRGDTNDPIGDRHRLVHIIAGNVVLNDLTLRDGLENGSTAAGGLRISDNDSIVTLNHVAVTANTAGGNAGGILNRGTLTINDSVISDNQTLNSANGGGGIFNSQGGTVTLNDSQVIFNTVNSDEFGTAGGGGIYNQFGATLILNNSVVDHNLADGRTGVGEQDAFGGGIYADNDDLAIGVVTLVQSSVTHNNALGKYSHGGGIYSVSSDAILVDRSVISFNRAESNEIIDGRAFGGGIEALAGNIDIQDSVISGNQALAGNISRGGGLLGIFRILRSTVANNTTDGLGGGLHTISSVVINSTFFGNGASVGGGISFASATGQTSSVFSSTIAGNTATDTAGGIDRGGNSNLSLTNTVLAGNTATNGGPNCAGSITSLGYNLVQNNSGCGLTANGNDKINLAASLAPDTNNGGLTAGSSLGIFSAMETRAPLPNSLLIDAGNPLGCKDDNDIDLGTDQIGRNRAIDGPDPDAAIHCDIGAVEYTDELFRDGFE